MPLEEPNLADIGLNAEMVMTCAVPFTTDTIHGITTKMEENQSCSLVQAKSA